MENSAFTGPGTVYLVCIGPHLNKGNKMVDNSKCYTIELTSDGNILLLYGRIGNALTTKSNLNASFEIGLKNANKLLKEKLKKGYEFDQSQRSNDNPQRGTPFEDYRPKKSKNEQSDQLMTPPAALKSKVQKNTTAPKAKKATPPKVQKITPPKAKKATTSSKAKKATSPKAKKATISPKAKKATT